MDKKKSLDLIKLEVLSCLNDKDRETLQSLKENESEFPWKELGDYQNLVAILPVVLETKYPENDLKDKTAMKLYNIREEIKAKIEIKKAMLAPVAAVEEVILSPESTEDIVIAEQIEVEEKVFVEVEEGISFTAEESIKPKDDAFRIVSKFKEKSESEIPLRQNYESAVKEPVKTVLDKDVVEKIIKDYVKSHLEKEFESLRKKINTNKMLSFILFVVSLILIIAIYFIK